MSPPPTDAFSLGRAHDGPRLALHTSPPSSTLQKSPSPGIHSIRRQVIRRLSNLQQPTPSTMTRPADDPPSPTRRRPRKKSTLPLPAAPKKTHQQPVDWEIPRKTLHASIGVLTLFLYLHSPAGVPASRAVVRALWAALALIVPADLLRLRSARFARLWEGGLGFLMRESEKRTLNGVIWYILGVNFALSAYPLDIAVVAILILSWADTAASTVGRLFGSYTPRLPARVPLLRLPLAPRKSLAGFVAAAAVGAGVAVGFWGWGVRVGQPEGGVSWAWEGGVRAGRGGFGGWGGLTIIGVVAGVVAGVAEALDLGSLDDNLTLPIISGGCLAGLFWVMGLVARA